MTRKIAVIGGGAAGMTAAIAAATHGAEVTVCEAGTMPGRKLLSTGNGRCNLTNLRMKGDCFHSGRPGAAMEVIHGFDEQAVLDWLESMGVLCTDRDGYVYPRSGQASTVREALEQEMRQRGVTLRTSAKVTALQVSSENGKYKLTLGAGMPLFADAVILAAGGKAAPVTGSDGSGFALAAGLGHTVIAPLPALVPLLSSQRFFHKLHGVRVRGRVTLFADRKKLAEDTGEIQMTEHGISGIPVFQVSRFASQALAAGKKVRAVLDFLPELSEEAWRGRLERFAREHREMTVFTFLHGLFPDKLCRVLLERVCCREEQRLGELDAGRRGELARLVRRFDVDIRGTGSFEQAQVTAGGVSVRELDLRTMESRFHPGLFFAGEVVDVEGICGGYNLQWAWSSGYAAGSVAAGGEYI
ncbi:MAG: aminoacetone oxidase family FAD-binding enzyme [Lachnospiraceae bacterium]|nr:aminoacetone oxidase family FAD-binding enzyme [Lachnospiraceae bacterium]